MMSRWGPIVATGIGGALLLIIASEISTGQLWFDQAKPIAISTSDTENDYNTDTVKISRLADIDVILGRPLFNWNRRPGQNFGLAATEGPLPRLAGILVSANGRYAIFAAPPGGKPQVVQEGGTINRFTIEKITADHVILNNSGVSQTVHTTFGVTQPPPMATPDAS
jgi:hypothetical protein